MTLKAASKHLATNKTCLFQTSCRFGDRCWYIHTRNPYAPSPSFFQRHYVAQTQPPHHPVAERSTTTAKSDQGISPTCPAVTGPFDLYIPLTTSSSTAPQTRATTPRQAQPSEPTSPPSSNVSINVIQEQSTTSPPVLRSNAGSTSSANGSWHEVRKKLHPRVLYDKERTDHQTTCKDCSEKFRLSPDTINWFLSRSLNVPLRCKFCRARRKQHAPSKEPTPAKIIEYQSSLNTRKWTSPLSTRSQGAPKTSSSPPSETSSHDESKHGNDKKCNELNKLPTTMSGDDPQTEDEDDGNESRDQESEDEDDGSESQTEGSAPRDRESEGMHNSIPRLEENSEEEDDSYHADTQETDAQRDYEFMGGNNTEFPEHQKNHQAHDQAEIPTKYCSLNDWGLKDQRLLQKLQQAIHDDNHNYAFWDAWQFANDSLEESKPFPARHAELLLRRRIYTISQSN